MTTRLLFVSVFLAANLCLAKTSDKNCAFPYIQTHHFDLRPMGGLFKGYALFISSGSFNGSEEVTVKSASAFPDVGMPQRSLKAYDKKGEWSQPGGERLKSAMGGGLPSGEYVFQVNSASRSCEAKVQFKESYIEPAQKISAIQQDDSIEISWNGAPEAHSYLVGLLPVSGAFPNDFFVISHADHRGTSLRLRSDLFPDGRFWIFVRSNEHLPGNLDVGYARESWGVSEIPFEK